MTTNENKREERIGLTSINKWGETIKIIEYNNANDILVEFQDEYKTKIHTTYQNFKKLEIKNPYSPSVYGIGKIGVKYPVKINKKVTKEYNAWKSILERCFDNKLKNKRPTYEKAICCNEWLLYENFYEWLHKQPNFNKWHNGDKWGLDKDILLKGNKVYSPETCCLVPVNVNSLFTKHDNARGIYPIGVSKDKDGFRASCNNPFSNENRYLGYYNTPEEAFQAYKIAKENIIKQVAQKEYNNGNITKPCYEAMMKYKVEITD